MKGRLKNGEFRIGNNRAFNDVPEGKVVTIADTENHHLYGKRYKIFGNKEWFEENCFEWIEQKELLEEGYEQ